MLSDTLRTQLSKSVTLNEMELLHNSSVSTDITSADLQYKIIDLDNTRQLRGHLWTMITVFESQVFTYVGKSNGFFIGYRRNLASGQITLLQTLDTNPALRGVYSVDSNGQPVQLLAVQPFNSTVRPWYY